MCRMNGQYVREGDALRKSRGERGAGTEGPSDGGERQALENETAEVRKAWRPLMGACIGGMTSGCWAHRGGRPQANPRASPGIQWSTRSAPTRPRQADPRDQGLRLTTPGGTVQPGRTIWGDGFSREGCDALGGIRQN